MGLLGTVGVDPQTFVGVDEDSKEIDVLWINPLLLQVIMRTVSIDQNFHFMYSTKSNKSHPKY